MISHITFHREGSAGGSVFQMEHNKSPSFDGFRAEFYQVFQDIISVGLMVIFNDFYEDRLLLFSQNFG